MIVTIAIDSWKGCLDSLDTARENIAATAEQILRLWLAARR